MKDANGGGSLSLETSDLSASGTKGEAGSSPRITEVSDKERIRMAEPGAQPLRPVSNLRELSTAKKPIPRVENPSAMQRTAGFVRTALPLLQKILPLLDGNVASVVASLLAPRPQGPAVDLRPVEGALGKIHTEHVELRKRVEDQNTSLKRMSDQLDLVKESTERHTLEQKEVAEDLHKLRKRVTIFAWVGLALLLISIAVNVILAFEVEGSLH